jgi:hypothetical protein
MHASLRHSSELQLKPVIQETHRHRKGVQRAVCVAACTAILATSVLFEILTDSEGAFRFGRPKLAGAP